MRVTFLVPIADMSGGARVVSLYARELAKRGHEVAVIVARGPRPTWRARLRRLVRRERTAPAGRRASHYDAIEPLVRRLDRPGPIRPADCPDADVVVATWWETAEWMMTCPRPRGTRSISSRATRRSATRPSPGSTPCCGWTRARSPSRAD